MILLAIATTTVPLTVVADAVRQTKGDYYDAFRQLDADLPTPNDQRTASGAPGRGYWQQKVDYRIAARLDEAERRISASQTVTYSNNSPDTLHYLWLHLDQNRFSQHSIARLSETTEDPEENVVPPPVETAGDDILTFFGLARQQTLGERDYGLRIARVATIDGKNMQYRVIDTLMRVDLEEPLNPGRSVEFTVEWSFDIVNMARVAARQGFERSRTGDSDIFAIAQWYPRLAAYTDYAGWHHKMFLGDGEFAQEFGNFEVQLTVPADHIVAATGELQNATQVLTAEHRKRLEAAAKAEKPVFIVNPEEAVRNSLNRSEDLKTWTFRARNVRDFAWASSRTFIWDALEYRQQDDTQPRVMAMSFYPPEAEPLWSRYSTHTIVHTLSFYSQFAFPYPYGTAQSVNIGETGGMEYPMISFTGFRPTVEPETPAIAEGADQLATYSRSTKYRMIAVIAHEIGHVYFPMVVNSDERQWGWMDEGINSFLDYLAGLAWEENFPAYGEHVNILDFIPEYMTSSHQVPVMTQPDSVLQYAGLNAYAKPAAALNVLRETVMGREQFDYAFKEYARRWKFRRPTPADFFRTMEDASGIDLDWFWRGWFYSTDHVDVAIADLRSYAISTGDPDVEFPLARDRARKEIPEPIEQIRNREAGATTYVAGNPELADFYNENDRFTVSRRDRDEYWKWLVSLEDWQRDALKRAEREGTRAYFVEFKNIGGLPSPLPLRITYDDAEVENLTLPAETWRRNIKSVTKVLLRNKEIAGIELDPQHVTGDADRSNNYFPSRIRTSRMDLYQDESEQRDLMQDMLRTRKCHGENHPDARCIERERGDAGGLAYDQQ